MDEETSEQLTKNYPFELPESLPSAFSEVLFYWRELRRGQAMIPYSDDIRLSALPGRENDLVLLDALANPRRFRFGIVGTNITKAYGKNIAGLFLDELEPSQPIELIHSQASAATELRAPTYFAGKEHARLLLPTWGDGHVSALLGIILPQTMMP